MSDSTIWESIVQAVQIAIDTRGFAWAEKATKAMGPHAALPYYMEKSRKQAEAAIVAVVMASGSVEREVDPSTLVDRLRGVYRTNNSTNYTVSLAIQKEAANRIEQLEKRIIDLNHEIIRLDNRLEAEKVFFGD